MSIKHAHFLTFANTNEYISLWPLSRKTSMKSPGCHLNSPEFEIDPLISGLQTAPNLSASSWELSAANCLTASR